METFYRLGHLMANPETTQRVQSTYMVQSMVSVVVISLMVWVSIPQYGYLGHFGKPQATIAMSVQSRMVIYLIELISIFTVALFQSGDFGTGSCVLWVSAALSAFLYKVLHHEAVFVRSVICV